MADNPNKTGSDRRTVSAQEHEIRYLKDKFQKEFPDVPSSDIGAAIEAAKKAAAPSESREEIETAIRKNLR